MQETIDNNFEFIPEPHFGKELVQFLKQTFNAVEITENFEDLSLKETALKVVAPDCIKSLPVDFVQRLKIVRDIPAEKYGLQFVALHLHQFNMDIRIEVKSASFVASYKGDDSTDEVNRRFINKLRIWLGISQKDVHNYS
ncbi:hypothetical protein [Desulfosporosinus lacus]|uniref:Uncharacterized protein n=1 Tax=Desulfosporosinus lacus DSM 15449 TaxID=1121420 RepID=A0A1M5SE87_9FIRM|nr:hypothetical protein [Desulfosporosinus lacus]SHH36588.1 hypothetical protein SAMN02746098_00820 [Desulfosporosinus lacus DSM 15449]